MKRVLVIGCPGSGKSTFSQKLHQFTGLPLYHLDMVYWNADKTTVDPCLFRERLASVLELETWIIDGNYASTMEWRMQACDTVIFLDYPTELCLQGIRERKGKTRSDIPWIEVREDPEFIAFAERFRQQERPSILVHMKHLRDKNIVVFEERSEAEIFLKQLQKHKETDL